MKVKEESVKAGLKLNIQNTKIMASGPITSWQTDQENVETVSCFIFLGSTIIVDGDCSHKIETLAPGSNSYDKPRQRIKKQRHHFADKGPYKSVMGFPAVMYGCESWTIRKAEHWRIDAFELWCWRKLLRVPWTARRSKQSILKEINPEYSLEGLVLKLKLQYFGHLMLRNDSLEKTDAGKDWGQEAATDNEMVGWHHWLNGQELSKLRKIVKVRKAWHAAVHGVTELEMT